MYDNLNRFINEVNYFIKILKYKKKKASFKCKKTIINTIATHAKNSLILRAKYIHATVAIHVLFKKYNMKRKAAAYQNLKLFNSRAQHKIVKFSEL